MQNNLPYIRRASKRYPLLTILASGLLLLASLGIILSSRLNTDATRLIPSDAVKTSLYFSLIEKISGMDKAYIVFSADNITDYIDRIEMIADEIRASRMTEDVSWKISGGTKAFMKDIHERKAPLFLSEDKMQEFIARLSPEGLQRELEKTKQRLSHPGNLDHSAVEDPLNLAGIFSFHPDISDSPVDISSGYFITADNNNLIMILTPKGSPSNRAFSAEFSDRIESILDRHRTAGFTAEITGDHVINLHEASAIKRQILFNAFASLISVSLIFMIFFRSLKGLLYVMTPVVFAIITTTAPALLLIGSLSEVTGAFAGLIVALGIDLGVLLYVRYLINLDKYNNPVELMDKSIETTYRSITTGALTSALTFLPMIFSSFRGFRELGLLTGIGLLICWVMLFTVSSLSIRPSSGRFIEIPKLRDIAMYAYQKPMTVIILSLVCIFALAPFIPHIRFIGDITQLGTDNNRPRKVFDDLKNRRLMKQDVLVTDMSMEMESGLIRSVEIKEALEKDFVYIMAAGDILPPEIRQKKNLSSLSIIDPDKVVRDFNRIAAEKGLDASWFQPFTERLSAMLRNRQMIRLADIEPVRETFERLLVNENDQWTIIVSGMLKNESPLPALEGYAHTGPSYMRAELISILKKDTAIITIAGFVLVNIILYLDFRKINHMLLCQAPVIVSILCTLGIMGITGISLTLMNAIVLVLLFGIGTDYTVHLLHQYQTARDISATFLQTGKALLVAGLTSLSGFSLLGFSSYRGLAGIGQVAAIGTTLCVVLSFTLVPSLLRLLDGQSLQYQPKHPVKRNSSV